MDRLTGMMSSITGSSPRAAEGAAARDPNTAGPARARSSPPDDGSIPLLTAAALLAMLQELIPAHVTRTTMGLKLLTVVLVGVQDSGKSALINSVAKSAT